MREQFSLRWENLSVEVDVKQASFWRSTKKRRTILSNISGWGNSGSLVAIMGPSGAGKTTFLGAVSGRLKGKSGTLRVNDELASDDAVRTISGYVQQEDIFTVTLTVWEHLRFMAAMRLGASGVPGQQKAAERMLAELSLQPMRDTQIALLSGGERKRLSLAVELLDEPKIILCDEPTTGLDSFSAITVVQKLQKVCLAGRLVLTTIHQPSSQIFANFDNIILLSAGRLVFQGSPDEAKTFFERVNLFCPVNYNPAEFYVKCITTGPGANNVEAIQRIADVFHESKRSKTKIIHHSHRLEDIFIKKAVKKSFIYEMKWLMWRTFIDTRRNISHHVMGYLLLALSGLVIALSYSFVQVTDRNSAQNIQGILLLISSELIFTNMYAVIYIFPGELAIYLREKTLYSIYSYFISKLVSLIPLCMINSISYLAIYFIVLNFFKGLEQFIYMLYVLFCTCLAASALGLSFSTTVSTIEFVDLILSPIELLILLVSGIWIKLDTLPFYFSWFMYLSPFYYTFQTVSNVFWHNKTELGNCTEAGYVPCYKSGEEVLQQYGFSNNYNYTYNIICLNILVVFYCLIGFIGILRKRMLYSSY